MIPSTPNAWTSRSALGAVVDNDLLSSVSMTSAAVYVAHVEQHLVEPVELAGARVVERSTDALGLDDQATLAPQRQRVTTGNPQDRQDRDPSPEPGDPQRELHRAAASPSAISASNRVRSSGLRMSKRAPTSSAQR